MLTLLLRVVKSYRIVLHITVQCFGVLCLQMDGCVTQTGLPETLQTLYVSLVPKATYVV